MSSGELDQGVFERKLRRLVDCYECIGKGGFYRILYHSIGAGTSRGQDIVVYQCILTQEVYHRTLEDFNERMRKIDA